MSSDLREVCVALKETSMYLRSEFPWLHPNVTTEAVPICVLVETAGGAGKPRRMWVYSPHLKSYPQLGIAVAVSVPTVSGISDSASLLNLPGAEIEGREVAGT